MVKLVDTTDLKSVARVKPAYRFDSGSGHQITSLDMQHFQRAKKARRDACTLANKVSELKDLPLLSLYFLPRVKQTFNLIPRLTYATRSNSYAVGQRLNLDASS